MIRRPWQIWLIFGLFVALGTAALFWLSTKMVQLDALREQDRKETEVARQQSELQERVSSALYRMDLRLLPMISEEASRPLSFYKKPNIPQSMLQALEKIKLDSDSLPTQMLGQIPQSKSEFVKLHFQIGTTDKLDSPTVETIEKGPTVEQLLEEASQFCSYEELNANWSEPPDKQILQLASEDPFQQQVEMQQVYQVPAIENVLNKINNNPASQSVQSESGKPYGGKVAIQRRRGEDRVNAEFNRRAASTRNLTQQQSMNQMVNAAPSFGGGGGFAGSELPTPQMDQSDSTGMQPLWLGNQLLLARRVILNNEIIFQCCWLDWEAIEASLKTEVSDILPIVNFKQIDLESELDRGTALTTIPVQLVVDGSEILPTLSIASNSFDDDPSGIRLALGMAWIGLSLGAIAVAFLLHGVIKLSERRASFVSAVTHELRTPLTTFRMYSEMLAEDMVPPDRRKEYSNTLRMQADRLSHLVENVLQFARLERSSGQIAHESVTVAELMDRFTPRLEERMDECGLTLNTQIPKTLESIRFSTQPSVLEQVIFNLVDNACKYGRPSSNNQVDITFEQLNEQKIVCKVRDYGPGVPIENQQKMFRPFHKSDLDAANTAPGVGLGLALCIRMAKSLGGKLKHENCEPGAVFSLTIPTNVV